MANADFTQLGVQDYNQGFLDALENIDSTIKSRQLKRRSLFRTMIQRSSFELGQGLTRKQYIFHPGQGDQSGLDKWHPIQISSKANNIDACAYNPHTVNYGFESIEYSGFGTERRTPHICVRDIRWMWEFKQQLGLVFSFLADVTNDVWENYAREQYIYQAVQAGRAYVLSDGTYNSHSLTYDPFSRDSDGDNVITIERGIPVSTLNRSFLIKYHEELSVSAPAGNIGTSALGSPLYGLVTGTGTMSEVFANDEELEKAYIQGLPTVVIENYGSVGVILDKYTLNTDIFAPRFSIKSMNATTLTLKREDPYEEVSTGMEIGVRRKFREEYLQAPFEMAMIFVKDVFGIEVPPSGPTAPGGGTSFGATPSLNGEFAWINNKDNTTNLLGEVGFYFGRYEAFAKPGEQNEYPIVFLCKRKPNTVVTYNGLNTSGSAVASAVLAADAEAVADSVYKMKVTLAATLDIEAPAAIKIDSDGGGSTNLITGIIADDSEAPTYILQFTSAPTVGNYTKTGGAKAYKV